MGIYIDKVSVYCDSECCDNKLEFEPQDGNLEHYNSNYKDAIEEFKNDIADSNYPWTVSGKMEGYKDDVLCPSCTGNIDVLKADINKLQSKLLNYEGV